MEVLDQEKQDIDKISLYKKGLNEPKYQLIIKNCRDARIKQLNDPKAFIKYSIYNNIDDNNQKTNRKILMVFDDMIADISTNRRFHSIVEELFIRCRKLNICYIYHTVLFSCSRRSQIQFYTLSNNEDS